MIAAIFIGQIVIVTQNLDNPAHQQFILHQLEIPLLWFLTGLILGFALQNQ